MKFGIIFGGQSYEHEISIVSAITLKNALKIDFDFIFCRGNGEFYLINPQDMNVKFFKTQGFLKSKQVFIKNNGFFTQKTFGFSKLDVDVFINLIHGGDGEDGKMASLLEFFNIKFIGPSVEACVMSFNKIYTKFLAKNIQVKTLEYNIVYNKNDIKIKPPFIVKPAHLGSSIGICVVKDDKSSEYALDKALEYDDVAIIEPFCRSVKEYNLAGCKVNGEILFSKIEEPKKTEILDFEQKYLRFSDDENKIKEADISCELRDKLKENFIKIYDSGFNNSIIRCDFFVIDNEVYLNEINPIPGSLAYYLFDDFESILERLAKNLVNTRSISIDYKYLEDVNSNK